MEKPAKYLDVEPQNTCFGCWAEATKTDGNLQWCDECEKKIKLIQDNKQQSLP